MSTAKRIFWNTIAQTFGKILAIVIGLLNLGLLTRYLGEQGFGQYSTVLAFLGFVVTFADFGLYLYVVREISKDNADANKIISNSLGIRLVFSAVVLAVGALIAQFFPYAPIVKHTMFAATAVFIFASVNQVLIGIFQKHLAVHFTLLAETAGRAVNLLLVFLFVRQNLGLPAFILAITAGNAVIFLLTVIFARRFEKFSIAFDWQIWKSILAVSWPLAFSVVLNLVYFKTDTIILSAYHSPEAVGVYSLPYKILEVSLAFPAMFVGLIMPLLSRYAFSSWTKFQEIFQRTFDALLLAAIPMVIAVSYYAKPMIDLIKGATNYKDSPAVFVILIFAAGIIFLGTLFGYAVVAVNQQKAMIFGYLSGAIIGLIAYFLLIPKYSYFGAAIGTVLTEITVAVFAYVLVRRQIPQGLSLQTLIKSLPAIAGMMLMFQFVSVPWILEILLGLGVYFSLLLLFKAIPLDFIRELYQKR